jgi:hypothetical protein
MYILDSRAKMFDFLTIIPGNVPDFLDRGKEGETLP